MAHSLKPKTLFLKTGNNTYTAMIFNKEVLLFSTFMAMCSTWLSEHLQKKILTLIKSDTTPMFTKVKFLFYVSITQTSLDLNFIKSKIHPTEWDTKFSTLTDHESTACYYLLNFFK